MVGSVPRHWFFLVLVVLAPAPAQADERGDRRMEELENRITTIENRVAHLPTTIVSRGSDGAVLFLYGCFCALWAHNTNRNPWAWFFLGLFFSVITAIVLLALNSDDRKRRGRAAEKIARAPDGLSG